MDAILIGAELSGVQWEVDEWHRTIEMIRKRYSGLLTYEFIYNMEPAGDDSKVPAYCEKVPFYDPLDFVSLSWYPRARPHVAPETCDGRYHWHRLGNWHLGESSTFWFTGTWYPNWGLGSLHRVCDGLNEDEDDNWVEIWVSVRFQGPGYVKGSTEPDGVWADRIAVRRIDPPKKRR